MKIIELKAERFKRLSAVAITPQENMVVISGKNGQGKSSVLDAIWLALGGKGAERESGTAKPIKNGEPNAVVRVNLGEIIVTRKWTQEGRSSLTVEGTDGRKYPSPQALLDSLLGSLSFDPLAFARMSAKEQRDALKKLVELPIDPEAVDVKRKNRYDQRTEVNRELKKLETQLSALPEPDPETPETEQSMAELVKEHQEAMDEQRANEEARRELADMRARVSSLKDEIGTLEETLEAKKKELARMVSEGKQKAVLVESLKDPDVEGFTQKIRAVEETNAKVRAAKDYLALMKSKEDRARESEALSKEIAILDEEKAKAFASAKFPVEGLAFDSEGILLRDVPLSQCSSAEQLRISIAMAAALNPKIRVIRISDGSLLDSESMLEVEKLAQEHDLQIWIERVDESGAVGVVIEDGALKEKGALV